MAWQWQGERKYGQESVSSDTTVHPRCLVDNNKSYSTGHNRPVFNILARRGGSGADIDNDTWRSNFSFVTSSMDRNYTLGETRACEDTSLGGYIYDISYSSVLPIFVLLQLETEQFGCGTCQRKMIRWIDYPLEWSAIRVTSICWHPSRKIRSLWY